MYMVGVDEQGVGLTAWALGLHFGALGCGFDFYG